MVIVVLQDRKIFIVQNVGPYITANHNLTMGIGVLQKL